MQLPEDCHLAYKIPHEAWYGQDRQVVDHPYITVIATSQRKVPWEFDVEEVDIKQRTPAIRVNVLDYAFPAFKQIPEFFAALGDVRPTTLREVVEILGQIGAVDETQRVRPSHV